MSKISKATCGTFSDLGERPKKHSTATRKVVELSRQSIEAKALKYLNQYDASAVRLRRVLVDFVRRTAAVTAVDPSNYLQMVNETLERYQQNGLLNDRRYGETMARGLMERGTSRRAIQAKLQGRGISGQVIDEVFAELQTSANSELVSARALVRKRRLGNYRPEAERRENYQRDLGVLARAGFDFETAKRALSVEGASDEGEF